MRSDCCGVCFTVQLWRLLCTDLLQLHTANKNSHGHAVCNLVFICYIDYHFLSFFSPVFQLWRLRLGPLMLAEQTLYCWGMYQAPSLFILRWSRFNYYANERTPTCIHTHRHTLLFRPASTYSNSWPQLPTSSFIPYQRLSQILLVVRRMI